MSIGCDGPPKGILFGKRLSCMLLTNGERSSGNEDSVMQEKVQPVVASQSRHRFWWFMPKPFDWLSSSLYIGIYIVGVVSAPARIALWQIPLLTGVLLALLLIDRLEYWRYGEQVPLRGRCCSSYCVSRSFYALFRSRALTSPLSSCSSRLTSRWCTLGTELTMRRLRLLLQPILGPCGGTSMSDI